MLSQKRMNIYIHGMFFRCTSISSFFTLWRDFQRWTKYIHTENNIPPEITMIALGFEGIVNGMT